MSTTVDVAAEPTPFRLVAGKTALIVIDMQRDFLLPGGFGESVGNDVDQLLKVVPPLAALIAAARASGTMIVHTREGHEPDLSDCPPAKLNRGAPSKRIGDPGTYGRIGLGVKIAPVPVIIRRLTGRPNRITATNQLTSGSGGRDHLAASGL